MVKFLQLNVQGMKNRISNITLTLFNYCRFIQHKKFFLKILDSFIHHQATTYIVGSEDNQACGLTDLCQDIGFRTVLSYKNLAMAEQQTKRTPICFFLLALECTEQNVPVIAKALRNSRNRQIRFAPLIGFAEVANTKMIDFCLQLGFDDILLPPFSRRTINSRLEKHLNKRITFFETDVYFGPDRRLEFNKNTLAKPHPKRGEGGEHRKIVIRRNLETGVNILRDRFHPKSNRQALETGDSIAI